MKHLLLTVFLFTPLTVLHAADRSFDSPDIVVYGATPAGIAAALNAAEGDRNVWLVEPTGRIGGMMTHGLSHSDFHSFEALNGPFLQFSQRVLMHYQVTYGEDSAQAKDSWRGTHGEPSVNLLIFQEMLAERPTITVLTNHRLVDVDVENSTITALHFAFPESEKITVRPRLVIDATYEGDLLAAANVPYRVGREAKSEYSESLAPEAADAELQGYNYRLCMTQNPANRVPVPVPDNYNREDYAAIIPLVKAGQFDAAFGYPGRRFILKAHLPVMPNGKHDINDVSQGLVRLSLPGHHHEYPDGDLATRRLIEKKHLDWQLGLIHFVQTDPALPDAFREQAATWGLCKDEFTDTNHIPPQIYVREARRMIGLRVYTEADTEYAPNDARARLHHDAIAFGEYSHNCHGTGHEGPLIGGRHTGEFYKGVAPYQIPYGVLVPRKVRNLLVPTACSASHVGFCALRLEPIWMSLGGAAGFTADMALAENVSVQEVDVEALKRRVWSSGGATIHVSDVLPSHPDFIAVQWWGSLGGLHGIEPAPEKPGTRGKHIVSQYFEAFPGHAIKLDQPLDEELKTRWNRLARQHGFLEPAASTTRGDWIRAAFAASKHVASTGRHSDSDGTLTGFKQLVRADSWTEKWPRDSGEIEERAVTAEIWNDAIQAALAQANSVHLPKRDQPYYLDGPITLRSGQKLTADADTEIRLKPGTNTCMVRNENIITLNTKPVPADLPLDTDITIAGGIWTTLATADNESNVNLLGRSSGVNPAFGTHGVILLQNVRRVSVKNVTVRQSKAFGVHLANAHDFIVENITLEEHRRDGVHVNGPASNGLIRGVRGDSKDDDVALNAWEWKNYAPSYGPIERIVVEDVTGWPGDDHDGNIAIRILSGVKRFNDGTTLACPIRDITLRRITDIRHFKIYDQPNLELGRDNDFSVGVGTVKNLRFEDLTFNRSGQIELHANTDGLSIHNVRVNHPITPDWHLLAIGPLSQTYKHGKSEDPVNWTEIFSPDLDCTVRNLSVSGVRVRGSQADMPVEQVVHVIEQKPNLDYPKSTPRGGTGKGIWIR